MKRLVVNRALAVGGLVAVTGALFLVAFTFFKKGGYSEDESYQVHAYFGDATGLTWKSRVQIAGIQIGEVSRITLEGNRARLELRIKKGIDLRTDACLIKSYPSALLPDAQLDASPGTPDKGTLAALPVDRRQITCIREATSTQQLIDSLSTIAADIKLVTGDLAQTVGGPRGSMREVIENLAQLTRRLDATVAANEGRLSSILANVDVISGDVREVTQAEKDRVREIIRNVQAITDDLKATAGSVRATMDDVGAGVPGGAAAAAGAGGEGAAAGGGRGVKQAVARLNDSLAKLDALLADMQAGKSVASRLVTDERMGRQLADAVDAASNYINKLDRLQVEVKLRSEWLLNQTGAKTYFGARILPRPDKYYELEVVSDPRGVDTVTTETITTRDPVTGADTTTVATRTLHEQKLTFTLQLAKRYGPVTFRGGIIESSGGVGSDLHLFQDALRVSVSIYQFSRPYQDVFPRAKVWLDYLFLQHFYLTAGADDFLNQWKVGRYPGGPKFTIGNDVFFGGGLFFTDQDLKTLFGVGAGNVVGAMGNNVQ